MPEGAARGVPAVRVGHIRIAVHRRVRDHAESPVHLLAKGLIDEPHAMAGGDRLDGLRQQDARPAALSAGEQRLVQTPELPRRAEAVAARRAARDPWLVVPSVVARRSRLGVPHRRDPRSVGVEAIGRHADPAVVEPERLEDHFAHVALERPAVGAAHDFAEHEPARLLVIAGTLTRYPARLETAAADSRQDLLPGIFRPTDVEHAEAGRVRQAVAQGDRFLAARRELGKESRDAVVERQQAALPELCDGDRRRRLARGRPGHEVLRGERLTGACLADGAVLDHFAVARNIGLRPEVQAGGNSARELVAQELEHADEDS